MKKNNIVSANKDRRVSSPLTLNEVITLINQNTSLKIGEEASLFVNDGTLLISFCTEEGFVFEVLFYQLLGKQGRSQTVWWADNVGYYTVRELANNAENLQEVASMLDRENIRINQILE